MRTIFAAFVAVMEVPEEISFQDAVVCAEYKQNRDRFIEHAREWTKKYAFPERFTKHVEEFMEMGFSKEEAVVALEESCYD